MYMKCSNNLINDGVTRVLLIVFSILEIELIYTIQKQINRSLDDSITSNADETVVLIKLTRTFYQRFIYQYYFYLNIWNDIRSLKYISTQALKLKKNQSNEKFWVNVASLVFEISDKFKHGSQTLWIFKPTLFFLLKNHFLNY